MDSSKIHSIEEFLENCLLVLGGMGFTGVLTTMIMRFKSIFRKASKLGKAVLEGLKTPKKTTDSPENRPLRFDPVSEGEEETKEND